MIMIELEYYCPECGELFISEIDINYTCKHCGTMFYTDWFHDNYSGIVGCLNTVDIKK